VKVDYLDQEETHTAVPPSNRNRTSITEVARKPTAASSRPRPRESKGSTVEKLRILVVEVSSQSIYLWRVLRRDFLQDNDINRAILAKRLILTGHTVMNATNGQEGIDTVMSDFNFDLVLMDIQ